MSIAPQDCACIILASGVSKRFGPQNKLLADLGGRPVITYALDTANAVGFKEVFVVSPVSGALATIIKSYGFRHVENETPDAGQGVSLALGANAVLSQKHRSACVMLADMPFVKSIDINNLMSYCEVDTILFSRSGTVLMPPVIFNRNALEVLSGLTSDEGGKSRVRGDLSTAFPLSQMSARDMDTPEDLEEMRELLSLS